jgi:gamma-glutamyl:cysteine ligase YbdK (ATP-grasp superfamily)
VPDAQTTVRNAAAVAAVVQSLAVWLAGRHDEGETFPPVDTWRIEENRPTA